MFRDFMVDGYKLEGTNVTGERDWLWWFYWLLSPIQLPPMQEEKSS